MQTFLLTAEEVHSDQLSGLKRILITDQFSQLVYSREERFMQTVQPIGIDLTRNGERNF